MCSANGPLSPRRGDEMSICFRQYSLLSSKLSSSRLRTILSVVLSSSFLRTSADVPKAVRPFWLKNRFYMSQTTAETKSEVCTKEDYIGVTARGKRERSKPSTMKKEITSLAVREIPSDPTLYHKIKTSWRARVCEGAASSTTARRNPEQN